MKNDTLKEFEWRKGAPKHPEIEKIFRKMFCYYNFYLREADDLPYWSTEMALVGNLSVAAAMAGFPTALEFYPDRPKKDHRRRADLWIGFSKTRDVLVEAKCSWRSRESMISHAWVNKVLNGAENQARGYLEDVSKEENPWFLCPILFVPISMNIKHFAEEKIEAIIDASRKAFIQVSSGSSFLAYYFLPKNEFEKDKYLDKEKKNYYPGIVIFGRIGRL